MSETYQSKRERWQRLLETLPAGLREHVSLRNVEAVAALDPTGAGTIGGSHSSRTQAPAARSGTIESQSKYFGCRSAQSTIAARYRVASSDFPQHIQNELADLIQLCFPDMPRVSAEALANSDVMDVARTTAQAHHQLLAVESFANGLCHDGPVWTDASNPWNVSKK